MNPSRSSETGESRDTGAVRGEIAPVSQPNVHEVRKTAIPVYAKIELTPPDRNTVAGLTDTVDYVDLKAIARSR